MKNKTIKNSIIDILVTFAVHEYAGSTNTIIERNSFSAIADEIISLIHPTQCPKCGAECCLVGLDGYYTKCAMCGYSFNDTYTNSHECPKCGRVLSVPSILGLCPICDNETEDDGGL